MWARACDWEAEGGCFAEDQVRSSVLLRSVCAGRGAIRKWQQASSKLAFATPDLLILRRQFRLVGSNFFSNFETRRVLLGLAQAESLG